MIVSQSKVHGAELSKIVATETLVAFVVAASGPGFYFLRQVMDPESKDSLNLAWVGVAVAVFVAVLTMRLVHRFSSWYYALVLLFLFWGSTFLSWYFLSR